MNAIYDLETKIRERGYRLSKKYDDTSGICVVTAVNTNTDTTIVARNTSKAALWNAYRKALEFIIAQLEDYEKKSGNTYNYGR